MFTVGQMVCRTDEVGVVEAIEDTDPEFPLGVRFPNGDLGWYTADGRDWEDQPVMLFVVEKPKDVNNPSQDFISELKALLEKYDARVQAGLYEQGQEEGFISNTLK